MRKFTLFWAILLCCLAGCKSRSSTAPVKTDADGQVLERISSGRSGLSFELAIGDCTDGECPLLLLLSENKTTIDTATLDFAAGSKTVEKNPADRLLGAGDPLAPSQTDTAWTAGSGEAAVSTLARPVRLTPEQTGVLIHQAGGFDHVKRRHYLFIEEKRKLKRVWTAEEGAGPHWSAVEIVDVGSDHQELLYFDAFQPGGDEPDQLEAARFFWNSADATLVKQPAGLLYAVTVGRFPNAVKAREFQAQAGCFEDYWVLPSNRLGLGTGGVTLAAVTSRKDVAETTLQAAKTCAPKQKMALQTVKTLSRGTKQ